MPAMEQLSRIEQQTAKIKRHRRISKLTIVTDNCGQATSNEQRAYK